MLALATAALAQPRRNVLFLLVDDGGFESPVWGNSNIETPSISALAQRSTIFPSAFTAVSSCSPSRSAVLTGLPTHQNGMYGLHQFPGNFQSHADVSTLPNLLNAAGFKTGIIGKHHVGPLPTYNFTYGTTAQHCWAGALGNVATDGPQPCAADYNEVTRNITSMKHRARTFLREIEPSSPFLLYVGFGDCHRCPTTWSGLGGFCEHYGTGSVGPRIPDWTPRVYGLDEVVVPPFLPDSVAVRRDIAGQYTAWHRLDTGLGLIVEEVNAAGFGNSTLTIFFSDNGIPFPSGKTNLGEQGQADPLLVSSPGQATRGRRSSAVVSSLDLMPTMLSWLRVPYPSGATAAGKPVALSGSSLLPLLDADAAVDDPAAEGRAPSWRQRAFGSHSFHSLYAYYPMRSVRTPTHRLVHNLAPDLSYPILEDVYYTPTWAAIEAAGEAGSNSSGWVYDYARYMRRPEWELYDVGSDPLCLHNLAAAPEHAATLRTLQLDLFAWRVRTADPWAACGNATGNGRHPASGDPSWAATHTEVCSF